MEYVNELANVRPANIIPDFVTSVDEASLFVDEATDRYISKVLHSVNLAESRYYQQTGTTLYLSEADDEKKSIIEQIKEKIVALFKKVWGFIQAAWQKVLTAIKKVCALFTTSNQDVAHKLRYYNGDTKAQAGSVHEFTGLDDLINPNGSYAKIINNSIVNLNKTASIYKGVSSANSYKRSNPVKSTSGLRDTTTDNADSLSKLVAPEDPKLKEILGDNKQDATKAIIEKVEGGTKDVSVGDLINSFDAYVQFGTNYSAVSKNAKTMYDGQKRQINAAIKTVKALRNINPETFTKAAGRVSTAMTILTNAATKALSDKNKEYAKMVSFGRRLVLKGKDFGESAAVQSDPLDSLFAE